MEQSLVMRLRWALVLLIAVASVPLASFLAPERALASTQRNLCELLSTTKAARLLGTTGQLKTLRIPLGCLYTANGKATLLIGAAPNTSGVRRVLEVASQVESAGKQHPMSVNGLAGYWQSVSTGLGPATVVLVHKSGHLVTAEVVGTQGSLAKARAVAGAVAKRL